MDHELPPPVGSSRLVEEVIKEAEEKDPWLYASLLGGEFLAFALNGHLLSKIGHGQGPEVLRPDFDTWAQTHNVPEDRRDGVWQAFLDD